MILENRQPCLQDAPCRSSVRLGLSYSPPRRDRGKHQATLRNAVALIMLAMQDAHSRLSKQLMARTVYGLVGEAPERCAIGRSCQLWNPVEVGYGRAVVPRAEWSYGLRSWMDAPWGEPRPRRVGECHTPEHVSRRRRFPASQKTLRGARERSEPCRQCVRLGLDGNAVEQVCSHAVCPRLCHGPIFKS